MPVHEVASLANVRCKDSELVVQSASIGSGLSKVDKAPDAVEIGRVCLGGGRRDHSSARIYSSGCFINSFIQDVCVCVCLHDVSRPRAHP